MRVRASGAKKPAVARSPSAASDVPLPPMFSAGGGRFTAIASRSVTSKSALSSVGNRCGSTRSRSTRRYQRPRSAWRHGAASRSHGARSKRVGAPADDAASIDRDVSITMNTSASRGTFDASWEATTAGPPRGRAIRSRARATRASRSRGCVTAARARRRDAPPRPADECTVNATSGTTIHDRDGRCPRGDEVDGQ